MKRVFTRRARRRRQPAPALDANGFPIGSMDILEMTMHSMPMQDTIYWKAFSDDPLRVDGQTRTYYISADKVVWDHAPVGRNEITGLGSITWPTRM
jgi:hypothetical protein